VRLLGRAARRKVSCPLWCANPGGLLPQSFGVRNRCHSAWLNSWAWAGIPAGFEFNWVGGEGPARRPSPGPWPNTPRAATWPIA